MKLVIIDGQGGGVGRALVEQIRRALPEQLIHVVGTNALATAGMLRAGADAGATGENAVKVGARDADVIAGPMGIIMADSMMGEMSAEMAAAVARSGAVKVLVPVSKCRTRVAGALELSMTAAIEAAVEEIRRLAAESACQI